MSPATAPQPTSDAPPPHTLGATELCSAMAVDVDGLSSADAAERLERHGPNRLPDPPRRSLLVRIASHFADVLIIVLLVAAGLTAVLGEWIDTAVIIGVVLVNAAVGYVQEGRAERAIEGIRRMLSVHARVRRDGSWDDVDAESVVPGDVVQLRSGDRVPADLRLVEVSNLSIEESALTGESLPSTKSVEALPEHTPVGDRENMAYSGSLVAQGHGVGVVTATGPSTELGRLNRMIAQVEAIETPLTRQMNRFGKLLSVVIVALSAVLAAIGLLVHDYDAGEVLLAAISFAVAVIPEGLPAILTITLAIGVQRMARRNAITRKLPAVETLGSVTVICSDKTGTLTRNEMTVRNVVTAHGRVEVTGIGYQPEGHLEHDGQRLAELPATVHALVEVMGVCNDAVLARDGEDWVVHGDPTEGALVALADKAGLDRSSYERVAVVPFESEHKLMATLEHAPGGRRVVFVKGAPERLLDRSETQLGVAGGSEPLERDRWHGAAEALASEGMRVLAAACAPDPGGQSLELADLDRGLVFIGLVGIQDPPRPEAIEAIEVCRRAGIAVKMITGDHAGTAAAVGAEMGIGDGSSVVAGPQLEAADDDELARLASEFDVFARTSPEHKLRLVTALQAVGGVVAMTGDGVNDAPALKRADVGVAMGIKGTEATKDAADVVLADDNFESIERAVEEGRTIYDNLRKSILFILPTNGAQGLVLLVAVLLGWDLPLSPVQILWINMVTAVTLALSFAFEPAEPGLMERPPRAARSSLVDATFLRRLGLVSVLMGGATITMYSVTEASGASQDLARTVALTTLVVAEVFYLFNARFLLAPSWPPRSLRGNPAVWWAIAALAVLQVGFVYLPFMNTAFGSVPLPPVDWVVPLLIGAGIFVVVELDKTLLRRSGS